MFTKLRIILLIFIIFLLTIFQNVANSGAIQGLAVSANVLVPALFPFMVCVLMIIKSGLFFKNQFLIRIIYKIFGINLDMFFTFILSMLGGYPIGAKLITELYNEKSIDKKTANIMLAYCVNAGPAFIVSVVGAFLNSRKLGIVLLVSHLLGSVIIALFYAKSLKNNNCQYIINKKTKTSFSEVFVDSVNCASSSIISICSFVVVFSVLNSYLDYFFSNIPILRYLPFFTEVSYGVCNTKNVYFISFLLGFSGVSIWCQIFAITKNIKLNFYKFALARVVHGLLSVVIVKVIINLFKIKVSTFSNTVTYKTNLTYTNGYLFLSLLIMLIVFLLFIYTKNNSGKILKDVV